MIIIFDFVIFTYLNFVFFYYIYHDLKRRKVPNKAFTFTFISSLVLLIPDLILMINNIFMIIIMKIIDFNLVLMLSYFLFYLKIIGGGDGKAILLVFLLNSPILLNFFNIFYFFSIFLIYYLIIVITKYIFNHLKNQIKMYKFYFTITKKDSRLERFIIFSYYKFLDIAKLEKYLGTKCVLRDNSLFYNDKSEKLQAFTQFRPPLLFLIYFVYLSYFFIIRS
jgi:Flp pilus assembly protein protease CpaA